MSTWEDRMAARAQARKQLHMPREDSIPVLLAGILPDGDLDAPRHWCASCGLPDPPQNQDRYGLDIPCPRCGSPWQWYGRIADRDGTTAAPPDDGLCPGCFEWLRYPHGQEHFGWSWWRTCDNGCVHSHHQDELWLAPA